MVTTLTCLEFKMAVPESVMPITRKNSKKTSKSGNRKLFFVTQELKFARALAGNDKSLRRVALKSLKKWLPDRCKCLVDFTDEDLMRLWKGLFYCMWMSDKPLAQEECAENISNLIHAMPEDPALLFFKCGLKTLMNEWFGLDQFRIGKFLMFVRRLLRQSLVVLGKKKWTLEKVQKYNLILSETVLNPTEITSVGLVMHFTEIYLEEVAKVTEGQLSPLLCVELVVPFIKMLVLAADTRIVSHIRKYIFAHLIKQSDLGMDYQEKYEAWKQQGFPGSINSMKKIEISTIDDGNDSKEEEEEKHLDPRAGRVNVDLPQLKFDTKAMIKALTAHKFEKGSNSKSRRAVLELTEQFKKLDSGIYPLGVNKIKLAKSEVDTNVRKAVNRLVKFDNHITGKQAKRKRKNKSAPNVIDKKPKLNVTTKSDEEKKSLRKRKVSALSTETEMQHKKIKPNPVGSLVMDKPIESIFRRNSGTWFVTTKDKTIENRKDVEWKKNPIPVVVLKNCSPKKVGKTSETTPTKKVVIDTSLNMEQDLHQHHAQILSSPAIPFDANKKPSKPLLKTPTILSPVNPFYGFR